MQLQESLTQPVAPIHSVRGTTGAGYTIPAPEYAVSKKPSAPRPEIKIPVVATRTIEQLPTAVGSVKSPMVVEKKGWFGRFVEWVF